MPSDCHKLDLQKQPDGSLKGTHSYYYERYSMFSDSGDGWQEKDVSFASEHELKEHLIRSLAMRYDSGVYIDGVKLEDIKDNGVNRIV